MRSILRRHSPDIGIVSKPMWIGEFDSSGPTMITEQRTQTGRCHTLSRARALSGKRKAQHCTDWAVPAGCNDRSSSTAFWRQREKPATCCPCRDPHLRFGKQYVVADSNPTPRLTVSPSKIIRPTMARSRVVRKLDQNRATSSIDSGTMLRLASLTRTRLIAQRGLPNPLVGGAR